MKELRTFNLKNHKCMYIGAIIGYLSWPVMILLSYLAVRWALRYFEKRASEEADK